MPRWILARRWSTLEVLIVAVAVAAFVWVGSRKVRLPHPTAAEPSSLARPIEPDGASKLATTPRPSSATAGEARVERSWIQVSSIARTPATEQQMAEALQELAARDPEHAMAIALAETNLRLRQVLRHAVLRGWASVAPAAAASWSLALPDGDRQLCLEAVFAGAAERPEAALQLAQQLRGQHPELAADCGQFLVSALCKVGAYEKAVAFAGADFSAEQAAWLNTAFFEWASHQPDAARSALDRVRQGAARDAAFEGLVLGWAMANPGSLATYAMKLPPGDDRARALTQALPQWVGRDTVLASDWINRMEPTPDLDPGVAAVATLPALISKRPEIAIGWAETIAEPVLRANTLRSVAQEWARRDADGLRRFLATTPNLEPADQRVLAEGLLPGPDA
jgi:hypothetical protein